MKSQRKDLTPQSVETERLKTQLKANANELACKHDIEQSLTETKGRLADSERDRKALQDKITAMTEEFER